MADNLPVSPIPSDEMRRNKGKKRKKNVSEWKDVKRKACRDSGNPYMSKKMKPVPGKIPSDVEKVCKCVFSCGSLTLEDKRRMFGAFNALNYDNQTRFLDAECMQVVDVRRRTTPEDVSRRQWTIQYYLPLETGKLRVCQKTLCDTFKITPRRLQILQDKIKSMVPLEDKRGKHSTRPNRIPDMTKDAIREHIESFPQQEGHYSGHETRSLFLNPDLSIRKMYQLFCENHPSLQVTENAYRELFNSEYKLRFGLPRSDTCSLCDGLYAQLVAAKSDEEFSRIEIESYIHHSEADAAYKTLVNDTEISKHTNIIVNLCVDLQVLFCPQLQHPSVYQRQYSCYNLAIHNIGQRTATMCFWHEAIAKRGSAEVSSCVLKYITANFCPLGQGEIRHLVIWSDRGVGQDNNWHMLALLQYLIVSRYFTTVEQKFVFGHSFLPCDSDFALIERNKKSFPVYEPSDWVRVISGAKQDGLFVWEMKEEDFKDLSVIEKGLNTGNDQNDFKIAEYCWFQITFDDPTTVRGRKSHNILQPWISHSRALPLVNFVTFPNLYQGPLPVKQAKKKDLLDMCRYIPLDSRVFYENLLSE